MIYLYRKGVDYWGKFWWIRVGKKAGLSLQIHASSLYSPSVCISWHEETKYVSFMFLFFTVDYFPIVYWEDGEYE